MEYAQKNICPICTRISSNPATCARHIKNEHDKDPMDVFIELFLDGKRKLCECGCGEETAWKGWRLGFGKFVFKHNCRLSNLDKEKADLIKERRRATLKKNIDEGSVVIWSKGKTKETDEALRTGALKRSKTVKEQFASGSRHAWSKGKTKETDGRIRVLSNNLRKGFKEGRYITWSKGKTKETDERVARMARNVSLSVSDPMLQLRLSTLKMLKPNEISRRIELLDCGLTFIGDVTADYAGINERTLRFICNGCGQRILRSLYTISYGCPECNSHESRQQHEIKSFVRSVTGTSPVTTRSVINPYEIDIFVEDKSFAIEFNGLWWHTDKMKNERNYHARKTDMCREKGIKLLHVFSDEWKYKRRIIESMIKHRLGACNDSVDARKCNLITLDAGAEKEFFSANHIDGYTRSKKAFGLMHGNVLIAALSLREPHHKSMKQYTEVARFACALNKNVRGALGKLISAAKKETTKPLLSYIDQRHGDGLSYVKVGFKKVKETQERFWWTDCIHRYDRFKFKANKKENKPEQVVANEFGVFRIFGCRNSVMVL